MAPPLIAAHAVDKRYGGRVALRQVTLSLQRGEIVALLGPNGAGKTTTLRLLAGLLRPTAGVILVDGRPQSARTWPSSRAHIGLLTETPGLWDRLPVATNLLVFARLFAVPDAHARVERLLDEMGLHERAGDPAGTLSKGMRQKLALARAVVHDPDVLLLDEPTAGLDPAMTRTFRDILERLRAEGCGIIVSTHNLDEAARVADRVAVLDQTIVALESPDVLAARSGRPRVRVTLAHAAPRFAALLARRGARDVSTAGHHLEATVSDIASDVPDMVRALVEEGAAIQAVTPVETTLEEAYLAITGQAARGEDARIERSTAVVPSPIIARDAASPSARSAEGPTQEPGPAPTMRFSVRRVITLLGKEWEELRRTWAPWLPGLFIVPVLALPLLFTWVLPTFAGEAIENGDFADQLDRIRPLWPAVERLSRRAATEAFVFQQFLVLVVLVPVTGAMSIAAHSVIGEKQTRSLEPILATPLTAAELLLAKVLAALLPALILEIVALTLYALAIAATSQPGVMSALASPRSAVTVALLGPLATLCGLQLVVLSSTRARDPRSAQQIGVLIVIPIVAMLVAQSAGAFWLTAGDLLLVSAALATTWILLIGMSAATFDAERILTRWR